MHAHQVEAVAVDVILFCPVSEHLAHILTVHCALGSGIVAAAGLLAVAAVGSHSIIILGNGVVEAGVYGVGVVINYVHDDADACIMQSLDHSLCFFDTHVAVIGVRRIRALGNAVVLGIIAPVELIRGATLVDGREIIEGVDLNMGNAQLLEIIDAGRNHAFAVKSCAGLGESEELTAVSVAYAGVLVIGEVLYMDFPNDSVGLGVGEDMAVILPAVGVRVVGVNIDYHGAVAVDADCMGVDILSLVGYGVGRVHDVIWVDDGVGVVGVHEIAFYRGRPYACPLVVFVQLLHRDNAEILSALFEVGACGIAVEADARSQRRPDLEGSRFG